MVIDIEKVIIKDRIRKDYGDIEELANDIKQNGLINPPVINKDYVLLAGERRYRALQSLGWKQIPVTMMDTRDAEHELNIEISENDVRKGFTKSERVDYMKRLFRIEEAKAKERMSDGGKGCQKSDTLRADDEVAKQFDVSRDTVRKEMAIADNRDLLDPSDFADWDEGKLSTNKAYQKIRHELDKAKADLTIAQNEAQALRNRPVKETVKEVVKTVVPDDYEKMKHDIQSMMHDNQRLSAERKQYLDAMNEAEAKVKELEDKESTFAKRTRREQQAELFVIRTRNYLESVANLVWVFDEYEEEWSEQEKKKFTKAVQELNGYAQQMLLNINGGEANG